MSYDHNIISNEEIQNQKKQIDAHRATLAILLWQLALNTEAFAPPSIFHNIHQARLEIRRIKNILLSWGVRIDDHPNDEETVVEFGRIGTSTSKSKPKPSPSSSRPASNQTTALITTGQKKSNSIRNVSKVSGEIALVTGGATLGGISATSVGAALGLNTLLGSSALASLATGVGLGALTVPPVGLVVALVAGGGALAYTVSRIAQDGIDLSFAID